MGGAAKESWGSGAAYELWVGRRSRSIAHEFIDWLAVAPGQTWGDVGCGTGALAECILGGSAPAAVLAVDRTEAYVREARASIGDTRARFELGDACALAWAAGSCDATASGLVLNFVPDPDAMAGEMARVTRPGGRVAAYVWDYAGGMQMIRHLWHVAIELNRGDSKLDQAERFPLCQPEPLEQLFRRAGLISVSVCAIDVPTAGAGLGRDGKTLCRGAPSWRQIVGLSLSSPWCRQPADPTFPASFFGKIVCPKPLKLSAASTRRSPKAIYLQCSRRFLPTSAGQRRKAGPAAAFR